MSPQYTISVVIITYNRHDSLRIAIQSILEQNRMPDEIIVLDDGSLDNTVQYLIELKKDLPQLKWKHQINLGVGQARKKATEMATSDIIAVLDSDDILYPNAIFQYIKMFENYPELDMIYGNIAIIDSNRNELNILKYNSYKDNSHYKRAIFVNPRIPFKHSAIAFKKSSYYDVGGYDQSYKIKVDIDLVLKFILNNKIIKHTEEIIAGFRTHENSISRKRIEGLKKWYYFILRYEESNIKRIYYFILRSIWELLKFGVEIGVAFKEGIGFKSQLNKSKSDLTGQAG